MTTKPGGEWAMVVAMMLVLVLGGGGVTDARSETAAVAATPVGAAESAQAAIAARLDGFHAAAAAAQFEAYFAAFAPDGVFIGTDATERWTVDAFKAYAKPHFDRGQGWTYTPTERHVVVAPDGQHASFDELLTNTSLGLCRGTGGLRRIDGDWKIEQYALTIPVPNDLASDVVKVIRGGAEKPKTEPSGK